jgi:hypothetical protein
LTLENWASTFVGTRYVAARPADDVSHLPPAARLTIHTSVADFLTQDRGHIRQGNDGTADARFVFFARWLDRMQFTQQSAAALTDGQTIKLLGAYLHHLGHGVTLQQSSTIVNQTLRGYIGAAANVFTVLTKRRCLAYDPATLHQRQPSFHPFLKEQLTQQKPPGANLAIVLNRSLWQSSKLCFKRFRPPKILPAFFSVLFMLFSTGPVWVSLPAPD